jgi:hypothetical protein
MHEPLHHRAATGSFERQELLRQLDRHLSETLRNSIFDVLDADRIDSVALVRLSLRLAIEYVAQVRGAPIAYDLEATSVSLNPDVAVVARVEALVESVPTAILELRRR